MSIRTQQSGSAGGNLDAAEVSAPPGAQCGVPGRSRFRFAAVVALLWITALVLLAAFTANPVTLNRDQIQRSPFVVTGTVVDLSRSLVAVKKEWRHGEITGEIVVQNLAETGARPQEVYVLPLSMDRNGGGRYRVTESLVPESAAQPIKFKPLIYPANEDAIRQLKEILAPRAENRGR